MPIRSSIAFRGVGIAPEQAWQVVLFLMKNRKFQELDVSVKRADVTSGAVPFAWPLIVIWFTGAVIVNDGRIERRVVVWLPHRVSRWLE